MNILVKCMLVFAAFLIGGQPAFARSAGELASREVMSESPEGIAAWKIRYWTGGRFGVPKQEATAVVMVPSGDLAVQPRGLIAWTHGTWGVASKCAPSQSSSFFDATPAVAAVRRGYVVVAPDYPGLGTDAVHPYLIGRPTAQSVLDALKAARSMREVQVGPQVLLWGESQGGHAALWAGMAAGTSDDLDLIGIAAGAPPTDLVANFREASDANARTFLTALAADSWSRYYGHPLEIGARRTPPIIRRLASNCIAGSSPRFGALLGMLTLRRDLRNYDFSQEQPWSAILRLNSAQPTFSVPLLIAQTRKDPLIAPQVTREFAKRACNRGIDVTWIDLPGSDHGSTAAQSADQTLEWIDARFSGRAAPNDCSKI